MTSWVSLTPMDRLGHPRGWWPDQDTRRPHATDLGMRTQVTPTDPNSDRSTAPSGHRHPCPLPTHRCPSELLLKVPLSDGRPLSSLQHPQTRKPTLPPARAGLGLRPWGPFPRGPGHFLPSCRPHRLRGPLARHVPGWAPGPGLWAACHQGPEGHTPALGAGGGGRVVGN